VLEHYFLAKPILPFVPNQMTDSLTARQRDILEHLVAGRTNQEIARKLHLSFHTVKTHVYAIFRKLNVHNRLEATLKMTKR
jgi:DNA-binding NarL/FixJ family response regulator